MSDPQNDDLKVLRVRLAEKDAAVARAFTDEELSGMLEESREEFCDNCSLDEHIENAIVTARRVAEELGLVQQS